jgi:hypothetical protein
MRGEDHGQENARALHRSLLARILLAVILATHIAGVAGDATTQQGQRDSLRASPFTPVLRVESVASVAFANA